MLKNLAIEVAANIVHTFHAFRHGVAKHRLLTTSVKAPGQLLYRAQRIECECGKVFAEVKEK